MTGRFGQGSGSASWSSAAQRRSSSGTLSRRTLRIPAIVAFSWFRATTSHSDNVSEHVRVGTRMYSLMQLARPDEYPKMLPSQVAGDYGLTNWFPSDEEGQKKMRLAELKNGRR